MPQEWTDPQEPAIPEAGNPIALRPETYQAHAEAVQYIERTNRARYPRAGRGRTTVPAAGAWAKLASGASISAGSGLTLGSGTVTLCSRSGASLTADGDDVDVLNAGPAITASGGDKAVRLHWTDGEWAAACT